ncbi:hypothetical protein CPC08DRAFT_717182 [Agrocybe pediades]|nr:hypothetical protein CPC08DRAFT_717182 [Agrocybe pediades]
MTALLISCCLSVSFLAQMSLGRMRRILAGPRQEVVTWFASDFGQLYQAGDWDQQRSPPSRHVPPPWLADVHSPGYY